jgi:hypothetical protein
MLPDICKGLLHQSEDGDLDVGWQSSKPILNI